MLAQSAGSQPRQKTSLEKESSHLTGGFYKVCCRGEAGSLCPRDAAWAQVKCLLGPKVPACQPQLCCVATL